MASCAAGKTFRVYGQYTSLVCKLMIKTWGHIFEANEKKLNGMIVTYQDKKGKELESGDVEERREVIYILKATMKLFKFEYEQ